MIVVVVDDDRDIRELMCEVLKLREYQLEAFQTADDAWCYLTSCSEPAGLLITDVVMPGALDGFDLAKLATEQLNLPTVVASGYCDQAKYSSHTPSVFLSKPWSIDGLLEACDLALRPNPDRAA